MPEPNPSNAADPSGRLIDVRELAQILNVPVSWLYERTRKGAIPSIRIGKYVRFDLREVMVFLKETQQADRTASRRV